MSDSANIARKRIYTGRVVSLDVDHVLYPDGSRGDLEIIRHPGASAIVPFLSDPSGTDPLVLLIKQYRYAAAGYLYEIPAGRLEPGRDPRRVRAPRVARGNGVHRDDHVPAHDDFHHPRIHRMSAFTCLSHRD